MSPDTLRYLHIWRSRFPEQRPLLWQGSWIQNDYCVDCRYCCGPQAEQEPYPMALLPEQIRQQTPNDFYLKDPHTAVLDGRGCRSCGEQGCRLERQWRPITCGLFPIVPANGGLFLYKTCPAALFYPLAYWMDLGQKVARFMQSLGQQNCRHLSLQIETHKLAVSHICLNIWIFETDTANDQDCSLNDKRSSLTSSPA